MIKKLLRKINYHDLGDGKEMGITILIEFLRHFLKEQYGFNSKRPFGNSDWYCFVDYILNGRTPDKEYPNNHKIDSHGFGGTKEYNKAVDEAMDLIIHSVEYFKPSDKDKRIKYLEQKLRDISSQASEI